SGIDDLIFDAIFWLKARKKKNMLKIEDILSKEEKHIAIIVPAWKEENVIDKMVINAVKMIDYRNYDIFIGIYPNDEGTKRSILSLEEHYYNKVHIIVNDLNGPTNKGQNLNMIFNGIKNFEKETGKRFDILVMQDSEDIIHPLSLKLFNYLIPPKDMVQIPVFPIEPEMNFINFFKYMTSSTYADEFAENHTKDIIVRKQIKGIIPSAGVGTAFRREALEKIAVLNNGTVFNFNNVTEDYEVAIRFHEAKLETDYFAEGVLRLDNKGNRKIEYIATREFFPNSFKAAVKQKSRWVYGITFQTPSQHKLRGKTLPQIYSLLRDRKSRYVNMINLPSYILFIYSIYDLVFSLITGQPSTISSKIFPLFSFMWYVVAADTGLAVLRVFNRFVAVKEIYGIKNAIASALIPPFLSLRLIWGNVINFFSTLDAWKTFIFGNKKRVKWNKTIHKEYAPDEVLIDYKRKLGDILLENKIISEADLSEAIKNKGENNALFGKYLVDKKYVEKKDMDLARALQLRAYPSELRFEDLNLDLIYLVPEAVARVGKLLVIGKLKDSILVAKAEDEGEIFTEIIQEKIGEKVEYVDLPSDQLTSLINSAYGLATKKIQEERKFGNLLVRKEAISEEMLAIALNLQKKTGYKLGKVLFQLGFITEEECAKNLAEYFGLEYKELKLEDIKFETARMFPEKLVFDYGMLPFNESDDKVFLCLSDPLESKGIEEVRKIYKKEIKPYICSQSKLILMISSIYEEQPEIKEFALKKNF
ncbi:phage adsorption protein NrfB, partial [bacterium]|nr:phage adsorption protein NrfB [bacterium]